MLKKLSIQNYKGFYEEQSIDFAIPNGKPGSGLTLIVGPNNTGKTTIIECLLFNREKKFKESERHRNEQPQIKIEGSDGEAIFSNIDGGSQTRLFKVPDNHEINFELIPSRRHWNAYSAGDWETPTFLHHTNTQELRTMTVVETAARLKNINRDRSQKTEFDKFMKKVIPHFTSWTVDTNDQGDYVKYVTAKTEHQANLLGDGIISIFRVCAHLVSKDKNRVLTIDEPELSLHPAAQKALSQIFSLASESGQIILCTHSPYFTNWADFRNGAKFIRLNKLKDERCTVSALDNDKNYADFISKNLSEWQKPQLLDTTAKEILFAEKVLFVEGQEDVGLLRKWFSDNKKKMNFEIFGYGVGGYSNMDLFLQLAKDLGLEKVGALYDKGAETNEACERAKETYDNYCIKQLSTEDVRDKYHQCQHCGKELIKEGVFDKHGKIKDQEEEKFEEIINRFINYFGQ